MPCRSFNFNHPGICTNHRWVSHAAVQRLKVCVRLKVSHFCGRVEVLWFTVTAFLEQLTFALVHSIKYTNCSPDGQLHQHCFTSVLAAGLNYASGAAADIELFRDELARLNGSECLAAAFIPCLHTLARQLHD